jgi:hypothetical protein
MRLLEVWKRPAEGGPIARPPVVAPVAGAALHYPRRQGVGDAVAEVAQVTPGLEGALDVIWQAPPLEDDEVRGWLAAAGAELAHRIFVSTFTIRSMFTPENAKSGVRIFC